MACLLREHYLIIFFLCIVKLALSLLQSRAETEISIAQKLVLDKDAELQAAEQALSGLQEVISLLFDLLNIMFPSTCVF